MGFFEHEEPRHFNQINREQLNLESDVCAQLPSKTTGEFVDNIDTQTLSSLQTPEAPELCEEQPLSSPQFLPQTCDPNLTSFQDSENTNSDSLIPSSVLVMRCKSSLTIWLS